MNQSLNNMEWEETRVTVDGEKINHLNKPQIYRRRQEDTQRQWQTIRSATGFENWFKRNRTKNKKNTKYYRSIGNIVF